jgi:hypothetical protein
MEDTLPDLDDASCIVITIIISAGGTHAPHKGIRRY